jgi:hypothetical protein
LIPTRRESNAVDPEAVIAEARGTIDETLLTRTRGGFLGRNVLADAPLLERLAERETLHYLLEGPASPTKAEGGEETELDTTGSYRTLVAVTDARMLLVAGSSDGDRALSLPYDQLVAVDRRAGLLTDAVVVETAAGVTWTVSVGGGSDAEDAVAYASGRLPPAASDRVASTDDIGAVEPPDGAGKADGPADTPEAERTDIDAGTVNGSGGADEGSPSTMQGILDDAEAAADGAADRLSDVPTGGTSDDAPSDGGAGTPPSAPSGESVLVAALFEAVVGAREVPRVEGFGDGSLSALADGVQAHYERLREHLAAGETEAVIGAAATVDALAAEGERQAEASDEQAVARQVAATRRTVRRAMVDEVFELDPFADLDAGIVPGIERVLQSVDAHAFEHFVADLWDELGFQTAVTRSSKDKGVDVVARQSTPVEQTVVIQAKRYGPNTKVGREEVQQYASLHRQEPGADLVVVVTTGSFTEPAREAARDLNVKLIGGDRLASMVVERDCLDLVVAHVRS